MAQILRQPSDLAWSTAAMTQTEVDGSNHVILTHTHTPGPDVKHLEVTDDGMNNYTYIGYINPYYYDTQSFVPTADVNVTTWIIKMKEIGTISDVKNVWVCIYTAKVSGAFYVPDTLVGTSDSLSTALITGVKTTLTFPCSPSIALSNATRYIAVVKTDLVASNTNYVWVYHKNGEGYATERFGWCYTDTTSYFFYPNSNYDMIFELWVEGAPGPAEYDTPGDITGPAIDAGSGKKVYQVDWVRGVYVDDEAITSVEIRGSDTAPTGAATGQGTDDDGVLHDYWSAPVWPSAGAWETVTAGITPAMDKRYLQLRVNMAASHDAAQTPVLNELWVEVRASARALVNKFNRIFGIGVPQ